MTGPVQAEDVLCRTAAPALVDNAIKVLQRSSEEDGHQTLMALSNTQVLAVKRVVFQGPMTRVGDFAAETSQLSRRRCFYSLERNLSDCASNQTHESVRDSALLILVVSQSLKCQVAINRRLCL